MRPDLLALTIVTGLDGMGPKRLAATLDRHDPEEVLRRLRSGVPLGIGVAADLEREWRRAACAVSDEAVRARIAELGVVVSRPGDPEHPRALTHDIDPAPILFRRGRAFDETAPTVAIVGTRRASAVGREVARELGFGLSEAGVSIVSGLALGIDGAAHDGAVRAGGAPPVAFVGGGPDRIYPPQHEELWGRVIESGVLATEAPPGAAPTRWRFPARNRMIAALADVVVVVESRRAGGSLLTVDEAIRRDRQVMAVPGSVRNGAAEGTNTLIADGCAPVLGVDDVLTALGLQQVDRSHRRASETPSPSPGSELDPLDAAVLAAVDDGATSLDAVVRRVDQPTVMVLAALGSLAGRGLIVDDGSQVRRA